MKHSDSYNIYETRTNLSHLLKKVRKGKEIIILHGKEPIAKIIPYIDNTSERIFGQDKDFVKIDDRFEEELPDSFMQHFRK